MWRPRSEPLPGLSPDPRILQFPDGELRQVVVPTHLGMATLGLADLGHPTPLPSGPRKIINRRLARAGQRPQGPGGWCRHSGQPRSPVSRRRSGERGRRALFLEVGQAAHAGTSFHRPLRCRPRGALKLRPPEHQGVAGGGRSQSMRTGSEWAGS